MQKLAPSTLGVFPAFPAYDAPRAPAFLEDEQFRDARAAALAPNALIVRAGETNRLAHVMQAGWAYRYARLDDGRRQILSFLVPGDIVDIEALMFPDAPAAFSVRALTDVEVQTFPAAQLRDMAERAPARRRAYEDEVRRHLRALGERVVDIGQRGAPERLARLFLELHDRLADRDLVAVDGSFDLPASQDHMADALGITPVHVNRTLRTFRTTGLIEIERRRARILDRAGLDRIAAS